MEFVPGLSFSKMGQSVGIRPHFRGQRIRFIALWTVLTLTGFLFHSPGPEARRSGDFYARLDSCSYIEFLDVVVVPF